MMNWKDYIREVLPNQENRDVLKAFSKAVLSGSKPSRGLCLVGAGLNGKTFISSLLHEAAFDIEKKENAVINFDNATDFSFVVGRSAGTTLLVLKVLDFKSRMAGLFKSLLSGENVLARRPYGHFANIKTSFHGGLILEFNRLPESFMEPTLAYRFDILTPLRLEGSKREDLDLPLMVGDFRKWVFEG